MFPFELPDMDWTLIESMAILPIPGTIEDEQRPFPNRRFMGPEAINESVKYTVDLTRQGFSFICRIEWADTSEPWDIHHIHPGVIMIYGPKHEELQ